MAANILAAIFISAPSPQPPAAEKIIKPSFSSTKAIKLALTSMILSALTVPTLFLMITVFIFPGIAFFLGLAAFLKSWRNPAIPLGVKALTVASMGVSIATFVSCMALINTGYRA